MSNINMNLKWLGREDIPYECRECPDCCAMNWIVGFYPGQQHQEVEIIKCWKCGEMYWIDPLVEERLCGNIVNATICDSVPDPMIPKAVLEMLVDAATEQYEDLKVGVRSEEDDPDLLETIYNIGQAIDHVKQILREGKLPLYKPPEKAPPWI